MKQAFFIIMSIVLLVNCSSLKNKKTIRTFEETLGDTNSKALTDYLNAFESYILKRKYPSLSTDKAYAKLLSEDGHSIVSMKLYDQFTDYDLDQYFKSQLWHEIYAPVDSVWIENSELRIIYVYLSEDGKKPVGKSGASFDNSMDKDSIIQRELSACYVNARGKYLQAVKSIESTSPFFAEFYHVKTNVGEITIGLFADMVKRYNVDLNDYLIRRIIAVELGKFINDKREPEKNTFANKA